MKPKNVFITIEIDGAAIMKVFSREQYKEIAIWISETIEKNGSN